MKTVIQKMAMRHYDQVAALWSGTEGMRVHEDDSRENVRRFLRRNLGMSVVATEGERVVGAVLCGDDGRRGILHHLAVSKDARRNGVGKKIVARAIANLKARRIRGCWILINGENKSGRRFWKAVGWEEIPDIIFAARRV